MKFQFPKFVDRLEIGLSEKINEFSLIIKKDCPDFGERFRIVPTQHSIWIESLDLESTKRFKIADRGVDFDIIQTYIKINELIIEILKVKSVQEIKNSMRLEIESVLKKEYKPNQFSVNVETGSYEITLFLKNIFVIKIFHAFGSDKIAIEEFKFWKSFYINSFKDLENAYIDTKGQVEELTKQLHDDLISNLPKF